MTNPSRPVEDSESLPVGSRACNEPCGWGAACLTHGRCEEVGPHTAHRHEHAKAIGDPESQGGGYHTWPAQSSPVAPTDVSSAISLDGALQRIDELEAEVSRLRDVEREYDVLTTQPGGSPVADSRPTDDVKEARRRTMNAVVSQYGVDEIGKRLAAFEAAVRAEERAWPAPASLHEVPRAREALHRAIYETASAANVNGTRWPYAEIDAFEAAVREPLLERIAKLEDKADSAEARLADAVVALERIDNLLMFLAGDIAPGHDVDALRKIARDFLAAATPPSPAGTPNEVTNGD